MNPAKTKDEMLELIRNESLKRNYKFESLPSHLFKIISNTGEIRGSIHETGKDDVKVKDKCWIGVWDPIWKFFDELGNRPKCFLVEIDHLENNYVVIPVDKIPNDALHPFGNKGGLSFILKRNGSKYEINKNESFSLVEYTNNLEKIYEPLNEHQSVTLETNENMDERSSWIRDLKEAFIKLGGPGNFYHLKDIYEMTKQIRIERRENLPRTYEDMIRYYLEINSRGRGRDLFDPKEEGTGYWMLKTSYTEEKRIWKVAPGKTAQYWNECLSAGVIAIGWNALPDLSNVENKQELKKLFREKYPNTSDDKVNHQTAEIWNFVKEINEGDIIVANKGMTKIVGIGKVIGNYHYNPDFVYHHTIPMDWYDTKEKDIPQQPWKRTVMKIKEDKLEDMNLASMKQILSGNELDEAIAWFKQDPGVVSWKKGREEAYKSFQRIFAIENIDNLTANDFAIFLDFDVNKSWTGLERQKTKLTGNMDGLKNSIKHLLDETIDIQERLKDVLDRGGRFHLDGIGPNIATGILLVCDSNDKYGVWNNRSEETLSRFGLLPANLPSKQSERYLHINEALVGLKNKYGMDLIDVDMFVYWADTMFNKAILIAVDDTRTIEGAKNSIAKQGYYEWGVRFEIEQSKEMRNHPEELPLPFNTYMYLKNDKVRYVAKVVEVKEGKENWKTYLKMTDLVEFKTTLEVDSFRKFENNQPMSAMGLQNFVYVKDPYGIKMWYGEKIETFTDQPLFSLTQEELKEGFNKISEELLIPEEKIIEIVTALVSGRHVLLAGPIGTGKTRLAKLIPEIFWAKSGGYYAEDYTATADWNTQDVIGGIFPKMEEDKPVYDIQLGCVTDTVSRNWSTGVNGGRRIASKYPPKNPFYRGTWLIIDEFNRADIDKAFGQLFTTLRTKRLKIPTNERGISYKELKIPEDYRIIGTLNTADKHFLFQLSDALKSRFAYIEIDIPRPDEYEKEIYYAMKNAITELGLGDFRSLIFLDHANKKIDPEKSNPDFYTPVYQAYHFLDLVRRFKKLGTAILKLIYQNMLVGTEMTGDSKIALDNALSSTLIPQLENLPLASIGAIHAMNSDYIVKYFKDAYRNPNRQAYIESFEKMSQYLEITDSSNIVSDFAKGSLRLEDEGMWNKIQGAYDNKKQNFKLELHQLKRSMEDLIRTAVI